MEVKGKKQYKDKIIQIMGLGYHVYGLSENGKLYVLNDKESEWVYRTDSPDKE